jgi:hypothetical protein
MKKEKPILQILASRLGVYEISVKSPADEYDKAERLSAAIKPAIAIIDEAVREIYSGLPKGLMAMTVQPGEERPVRSSTT